MGGASHPGPWSFEYYPWLKEMHDCTAELVVGQKSAQMGFTEHALNTAFYNIDVLSRDVLYVLPAKTPDASDFSAARFDAALELSPHLSKLFSDVKNVGHKRAGSANMYIRGSRARSGLKSVPVGLIILDEVDEMTQENIPLALERTSGQVEHQVLMVSTPTIMGTGINKYFLGTTQEHFFFRCPSCSRATELIFPDCLEVTAESLGDSRIKQSRLLCKECKATLPHETKHIWLNGAKWVASRTDADARGFHISQLYSTTVKPLALAESFLRAQLDPADEQEFFNSKLGVPHVVSGAAVSDQNIDECRGIQQFRNGQFKGKTTGWLTMGVDVGKRINVEIDQWIMPRQRMTTDLNIEAMPQCVYFGIVMHFEELDILMREWRIHSCVIDANPERRKSYEFACRFYGHVKLCLYGRGITGKQIHAAKDKSSDVLDEHTVMVDRTSWLDLSLGRFKRKGIMLPMDVTPEYREQIKASVRIYSKDKDGNPVGSYVNGSNPDHYSHSRNYSEIALPFAIGQGQIQDITQRVI